MRKVRLSSILISAAVVLIVFFIALNFYKKEPLYSYVLEPKPLNSEIVMPEITENPIGIIAQTEQPDKKFDIEAIPDTPSLPETIIYYAGSGTKWHSRKDCRYLKNSREIFEGNMKIAEQKALAPCSECADSNKDNQTFSEKSDNELCYYTENGTKWHLDKNCRYLKNSKNISEGYVKDMEKKGLTPCSGCGDNR